MISSGTMASQNPNKRQKISGPVITKYSVPPAYTNPGPHNQQPYAPRRGFTHPPTSQNLQNYSGSQTPISANSNLPGPWQQHTWPLYPLSRHHSQQWHPPGLPTPTGANDCQRTISISSASSGTQQNGFRPQSYVQQHLPAPLSLVSHGSSEELSLKFRKGSFIEERGLLLSQQETRNHYQQSEASEHDVQVEPAEESWWEEVRALDYSEGSYDSKHVGKVI